MQVPQRLYTLDELKLNGIETMSLLSPVDTTLGSIERNLLIAAIVGGVAAWNVFGISQQQIFYISLGLLFLWTLDLVLLLAPELKFTAFIPLYETINEVKMPCLTQEPPVLYMLWICLHGLI